MRSRGDPVLGPPHLAGACPERKTAETAVTLLEEALFLRMNGERPPGSPDATWHAWDDRAERFLRSLLPPEAEGGS